MKNNLFYETNENGKYDGFITSLADDALVKRYLRNIKKYTSKINSDHFYDNSYIVQDKNKECSIGYLHIFPPQREEIEFMYAVARPYRSLGYGKQIVSNTTEWIFSQDLQIQKIVLVIHPSNFPSVAVARANGYSNVDSSIRFVKIKSR